MVKKTQGWMQAVYPEGIWHHNEVNPADAEPIPDQRHPMSKGMDSYRKVEKIACIRSLDI
ncbi:MAG: hypothetical protein ACE15F_17940 [bacterium]